MNESDSRVDAKSGFNRGQLSWALADCAREPIISLVASFIFAPYFVTVLVGDAVRGQALWGIAIGIPSLILALGGPTFGAVADQLGRRKPWIAPLVVLGTIGCCGLWFSEPGQSGVVELSMVLVMVGLVCTDGSLIFTNAMLPNIAEPSQIGRLSGLSWGISFLAGVFTLGLFLGLDGLTASLDLDPESHLIERLSGVLSGLWFGVFMLPLLLFTPDAPTTGKRMNEAIRNGLENLVSTFRDLKHYRNIAFALGSGMGLASAVIAFYSFTGLYASGLFGWDITATTYFGIANVLGAAFFAFGSGILDDRLGPRRVLLAAALLSVIVTSMMAAVTPTSFGPILFESSQVETGFPTSPSEIIYLVLGFFQSGMLGVILTSGRSLMSRIAPLEKMTEFFGLSALFGRSAAFVAPILISWATIYFGSQRAGLFGVVILLYGVGFIFMLYVQEERATTPDR
ncbi:MAG: MFS transporter [Myxococcales bacterium]